MSEMTPQELERLARDIVVFLGFEWRFGEMKHDRLAVLVGPDECQVLIHPDWRNNDRLEISGGYPPDYSPYKDAPEITVAANKGPAKIARDIARRFFPKYHPLWLKYLGLYYKARQDAAIAELMQAILAEDLGGHARARQFDRRDRLSSRSYSLDTPWSSEDPHLRLEVKTYQKPHVKMELDHLSLDLAREVCALIRDRLEATAEEASRE